MEGSGSGGGASEESIGGVVVRRRGVEELRSRGWWMVRWDLRSVVDGTRHGRAMFDRKELENERVRNRGNGSKDPLAALVAICGMEDG